MRKEAPKLKLIYGGKKDPKIILNKELFLFLLIVFSYVGIILYVN